MVDTEAIVDRHRAWSAALDAGDRAAEAHVAEALPGLARAVETIRDRLCAIGHPEVPGVVAPSVGLAARVARLECAGFPGLFGVPAFEPIRARLLDGVAAF